MNAKRKQAAVKEKTGDNKALMVPRMILHLSALRLELGAESVGTTEMTAGAAGTAQCCSCHVITSLAYISDRGHMSGCGRDCTVQGTLVY